ncbi:type II secretion system protein [Nocardioides sp. SLBN-35]|uniref:type II secretion system protein n=1 Tax=Nocardioides sp. SLBN-35 TaxID=2768445 RepID=UPI0011511AD3|nr:type II secretion system protein [Nocardioides sp. SLBN-35]TQK70357.1 prepilin-type N-terminal cleavage/methylation domain-containing protein [Nocardioides sp. SLBN-35]
MFGRRPWRADEGVTLIEVLVAITILGIAGVAIMAGLQTSILASDIHRKQTTGGAYVRSYAEALQQYLTDNPGAWVPCAPVGTWDVQDLPASYRPDVLNGGAYVGTQIASSPYAAFDGNSSGCGVNTAVRLTLQVASTKNGVKSATLETLDVVIQRPCGGAQCLS